MRQLNRLLLREVPLNQLANAKRWENVTRLPCLCGPHAQCLRKIVGMGEALALMKLRPVCLMKLGMVSCI